MSHDCDCDSCQETDSRWAYSRRLDKARVDDCPKGKHIAELWSTSPKPGEGMYRCGACRTWCDQKGRQYEPENESNEDYRQRKSMEILGISDDNYPLTSPEAWSSAGKVSYRPVMDMPSLREEMNRKLRELSAPECKKHPRYQAKRKPRVPCEGCWRKYVHINPR
jgi:hypothetical protein